MVRAILFNKRGYSMFGFGFGKSKSKQQESIVELEKPSGDVEMINSMAVFTGLEKPIYNDNGIVSYHVPKAYMLRSKKNDPVFNFYNDNDIDFCNVNNKACCIIKDKNFEDQPPFFASNILINLNKQDDDIPNKLLLENRSYAVYGSDVFEIKKGKNGEDNETIFKITILSLLENKYIMKVYKFDFRLKKSYRHKDYLFIEDPVFIGSIFNILAKEDEDFALDILAGLNWDRPKVFL
jgi:hypothetical protein